MSAPHGAASRCPLGPLHASSTVPGPHATSSTASPRCDGDLVEEHIRPTERRGQATNTSSYTCIASSRRSAKRSAPVRAFVAHRGPEPRSTAPLAVPGEARRSSRRPAAAAGSRVGEHRDRSLASTKPSSRSSGHRLVEQHRTLVQRRLSEQLHDHHHGLLGGSWPRPGEHLSLVALAVELRRRGGLFSWIRPRESASSRRQWTPTVACTHVARSPAQRVRWASSTASNEPLIELPATWIERRSPGSPPSATFTTSQFGSLAAAPRTGLANAVAKRLVTRRSGPSQS